MKLRKVSAALAAAVLLTVGGTSKAADPMTAADLKAAAIDAYVYGYSLITTEVTRVQMSNVPKAEGLHAPMNQFINVPRYPPADYRGVSAPNADTLYSLAWLDLSEPQVFSHPDMGSRFHLFPMIDLWMTIFASPGSRTGDHKAAAYLLTGPGWKGDVPKGMQHITSATRYMVILGRTYADGSDADYKKVNALQAQYKITPLAKWGKPFKPVAPPVNPNPGFSMTDSPQDVILAMGTAEYFDRMAKLMCEAAPPYPADKAMLERIAKIGIVPCQPYDASKLDAGVQAVLKDLPKETLGRIAAEQTKGNGGDKATAQAAVNMLPKAALQQIIKERAASMGTKVNGWVMTKGLGVYGTDYMKRAVVAAFGWPANLQEDAVYPYTEVDSKGETLSGAHKYTLTFPKGQTPPVKGFWSITMYMIDNGWWFVPNPLNRFTVSLRDHPKFNADGSLTLYFQNESPGKGKENNWLPAPKGEFIPMLRMYWPQPKNPSILDGSWAPPAVVRVD